MFLLFQPGRVAILVPDPQVSEANVTTSYFLVLESVRKMLKQCWGRETVGEGDLSR